MALIALPASLQSSFYLREKLVAAGKERYVVKTTGASLFGGDTVALATRHYVEPDCQESDPSQRREGDGDVPRQPLIPFVKTFISEPQPNRHLLVLAGSGMGKTSFVLNTYAWAARYLKGKRVAAVPLGSPDADSFISALPEPRSTVLFLDAMDEDTEAMRDTLKRFQRLMTLTKDFNRVIITSRTQFFRSDAEIPDRSGIAKFGDRAGGPAEFELVRRYISPLTRKQIGRFLWKRYPLFDFSRRAQAKRLVMLMPNLSMRPMLLSHVPALVAAGATTSTSSWELYDQLLEAWFNREHTWFPKGELAPLSRKLAMQIHVGAMDRGGEFLSIPELKTILGPRGPDFEHLVTSRSLLNRDSVGNCKFAHRSIMEFLVAQAVACDGQHVSQFTDQIDSFLREKAELDRRLILLTTPPRQRYYLAGQELRGANLSSRELKNANFHKANLFKASLRQCNLNGSYFRGANLCGADLTEAQLANCDFRDAYLEDAKLERANLQGADLTGANLARANLYSARYNHKTLFPAGFVPQPNMLRLP